jgi:hypothetical protein
MSMMVFFQVFFEKSNRREFLIMFTGLPIDFNETLVLSEFLKGLLPISIRKENISKDFIRNDLFLDGGKRLEVGHDDHLLAGSLNEERITLQMGHELFLLMTLIL